MIDLETQYAWEMMRKRRIAQSTGYRTDDLILHLDGIQNTRAGDHNPSATIWEDLAGNMDITLYNATWGGDYCSFTGGDSSYGVGDYWTFTKGKTVEVVYKRTGGSISDGYGQTVFASFTYGGVGNGLVVFLQKTRKLLRLSTAYVNSGTGTAVSDQSYIGLSENVYIESGNSFPITISSSPLGITVKKFIIGNLWSDGNMTSGKSFMSFYGNIYAVRVYDANLTAEELYAHWLIDKARFNIPEE